MVWAQVGRGGAACLPRASAPSYALTPSTPRATYGSTETTSASRRTRASPRSLT